MTAAQIVSGCLIRAAQTAAVTDTLDSAVNIMAAIPNCVAGTSFRFRSVNAGDFTQTLAAGAGIILSGTIAVAPGTWREWVGVVSSVATPAIAMTNIGSGAA